MPSIPVLESDYVNASIPINTESSYHFFELGHDTSLKELMNRIYKLELEVENLKQQLRGDIKL